MRVRCSCCCTYIIHQTTLPATSSYFQKWGNNWKVPCLRVLKMHIEHSQGLLNLCFFLKIAIFFFLFEIATNTETVLDFYLWLQSRWEGCCCSNIICCLKYPLWFSPDTVLSGWLCSKHQLTQILMLTKRSLFCVHSRATSTLICSQTGMLISRK